jgi:YfiR/HmsC-like
MEFLKRTRITAVIGVLALFMAPLQALAQSQSEYALKSVFLYNFCRFIEWPESAFASPNEPFVIGIVGNDPFGPLLTEAVGGEKYHNRPIRIDYFRGPGDIRRCHLLFISSSESARVEQILAAVAGKSVVTVGETEDFLDRGGMIALNAERNRVRLRINAPALHSANLAVSSKLLRVAEVKR